MRIDHVAHTCRDPHATHLFYTEFLGLKLVQAYAGRELMLVYELADGSSLAFTTSGETVSRPPDHTDWQRGHVGLTVETRAELEEWLARLDQHGIQHQLVENERIYFADPDGLVLELEVASNMIVNPAATDVLSRWRQQR